MVSCLEFRIVHDLCSSCCFFFNYLYPLSSLYSSSHFPKCDPELHLLGLEYPLPPFTLRGLKTALESSLTWVFMGFD